MRKLIVNARRSLLTLAVLGALLALVLVPWSTRISIPSILVATHEIKVYPPHAAKLQRIYIADGVRVQKGDVLFQFVAPNLEKDVLSVKERAALIQARLNRISSDKIDRTDRIVLLNQLEVAQKELQGLELLLEGLVVKAQFSGTIIDIDPELMPGMWIGPLQPLALLQGNDGLSVEGYVNEGNLFRFSEGAAAKFIPEDPTIAKIELEVESVSYAGIKNLDNPYLALRFGGQIATSEVDGDKMTPKDAYYAVILRPTNLPDGWQPGKVMRGNTLIQGLPQSLFARARRGVLSVVVREMGF